MVDVVPAGNVPVGRAPDTTGATVSGGGGLTGVTMSAWISATANARLYTRTSSIVPLKYWLMVVLPPMRSAFVVTVMVPVWARLDTWTPLTNSRCMAPS